LLRDLIRKVLKELPKKTEVVEYCEMSGLQSIIYNEALRRSRTLAATASPDDQTKELGIKDTEKRRKGSKAATKSKVLLSKDTSSNVLMDLRKAASHPMLFRRRFTDEKLSSIAHALLRLPDFVRRQAQFELVKEDMEVMTDSELQFLCKQHKVFSFADSPTSV
jgi:SWI/SNF-related matrix-associated actin-dependent regulator 1 of chromatin subfamily A